MKKFIEVYDNVLNPKLVDIIENKVLKTQSLQFQYMENLTYTRGDTNFHFKPGILHNFTINTTQLINTDSLFNNVLYNFCSYKGIIINQVLNGRIFVDLPTPNPTLDTPPHVDLDTPHLVCLYYINDSEGDTVFYEDDKVTERKRVSPKKGRIAFFDGSIYHAGTPSETNSRAVINFNFIPYL